MAGSCHGQPMTTDTVQTLSAAGPAHEPRPSVRLSVCPAN